MKKPNYKRIYLDVIKMKCPEKLNQYRDFITPQKDLNALDILMLNDMVFGKADKETQKLNQQVKSYDKSSVIKILEYQKKYRLNNVQLSRHFHLSRNTITAWKRRYRI